MPPNRFESEVESFLEGSHGDRTHIKRADHHTVTPLCGTLLRRHRFQESGPPGLQDPDAIPVAGGGPWPGDQWAADVTNVVKPTQFKSPREDLCYKRRQSEPKNQHFHRKSRWIDDVRNNGAEIHTKNTLD